MERRPGQKGEERAKEERAYGTPDSHVVPHRSTDRACSGLTAQFGRDTVLFTEYGRRRVHTEITAYMVLQLGPRQPIDRDQMIGACRRAVGGRGRGWRPKPHIVPTADQTHETAAVAPALVP